MNLIDNAIKYSPEETPIELSAGVREDEMVISLLDRGHGIPEGAEARIFEKFVRGSTGGGIGLGLAICEAIVKAHGGRIWAENRTGGGAVFFFTLPLGGEMPVMEREQA